MDMERKSVITKNNSRLLYLTSDWLNHHEDLVSGEEVEELCDTCGVEPVFAYALLLASAYGIETEDGGSDELFFREWLLPMLHHLDPAVFEADPYYRHVQVEQNKTSRWTLRGQEIRPYQPFVCDDMVPDKDGRVLPQIGFFDRSFAYPAVLEGGREWMTLMPNETVSTMPAVEAAYGKVLTFGLGLGYFVYRCIEKENVDSVTVVERDPEVISLFKTYLLPQFPNPEKIRIVQADAFQYAETQMGEEGFDFIFVDIWHDVGDGLPLYGRFKTLEHHSPGSRYMYWIEPTMRCYQDDSLWAE